ncbi:MAG: AbrB family transcriptional regulator [Thermoplasmata archaeon]|nr:AbrB family transcriptional regulator [Candidatus Sysuiplasma acidicola]MBX8638432.1 AbrB family transcriptional regulator [Candidatus Sysuiplasma acidicola]MBX8646102.1 AbrB family transcriptional regulator [Candidatus Sysuiplasma acidicola]
MSGDIEEIDRNGRIYLPSRLRRGLGKKFLVLREGNRLVLVPLPDDPAKDLAELGKNHPGRSLKQFRAEILKEAEEDIRRH